MTDHESITGPAEVVYKIDTHLLARMHVLAVKRGWDTGRCFSNGIALLQTWDRLRAIIVKAKIHGLEVKDFGLIDTDNETGVSVSSLMSIGNIVGIEKGEYIGEETQRTLTMPEDLRLNLELYAHSMSYDDLDPVFRDAALFFCNVQELIDQGPTRPGAPS
jgi:hypothetical protein